MKCLPRKSSIDDRKKLPIKNLSRELQNRRRKLSSKHFPIFQDSSSVFIWKSDAAAQKPGSFLSVNNSSEGAAKKKNLCALGS